MHEDQGISGGETPPPPVAPKIEKVATPEVQRNLGAVLGQVAENAVGGAVATGVVAGIKAGWDKLHGSGPKSGGSNDGASAGAANNPPPASDGE